MAHNPPHETPTDGIDPKQHEALIEAAADIVEDPIAETLEGGPDSVDDTTFDFHRILGAILGVPEITDLDSAVATELQARYTSEDPTNE